MATDRGRFSVVGHSPSGLTLKTPPMLKALELNGFKSFADVTRFEFPPGITVVVGPNGSGKSNIVDAMKWVLGEQSARSLRGKEMADVIFKGAGHRKPANTAEATIIFENTDNVFETGTDEVRVTRRVYRSGEGEYLINGQASRLKDIKNMFRGTGVGADAYSLIEQGKVDSLLQASPKDRRAIFEEAAGISRFKAKKIETQRRLERVDQNLLRLSDIVEEVDGRLRRLKSQAGKARRYQEHASRLQALRTQVGRVDWQQMTAQLEVVDASLVNLDESLARIHVDLHESEGRAAAREQQLGLTEEQLRDRDSQLSRNREKMVATQSSVEFESTRLEELEDELSRHRRQWLAMTNRSGSLQSQWKDVQHQHDAAERDYTTKEAEFAAAQAAYESLAAELVRTREDAESRRGEYTATMREAAELSSQIATFQSQLDAAEVANQKWTARLEELQTTLDEARDQTEWLEDKLRQVEDQADAQDAELKAARHAQKESAAALQRAEQERSACRERRAILGERIGILEEIDARMEGVGSAVQELLALAAQSGQGALHSIRGMVADLIQLKQRSDATMIAAALGERAQHLVVAGDELMDLIAAGNLQLSGRVGFLQLQAAPPPQFLRDVDLSGQPGVIGRADQLVTCGEDYRFLMDWLLGDTWLVDSLLDAVHYHRSLATPPRLVTRGGAVLDRDGRLMVGPPNSELQLIPRRVELEELREQAVQLDTDFANFEQVFSLRVQQQGAADQRLEQATERYDTMHRELAAARLRAESAAERHADLTAQQQAMQAEQQSSEAQASQAEKNLVSFRAQLESVSRSAQSLEAMITAALEQIESLEAEQKSRAATVAAARVAFAKSEQLLDSLRARSEQLHRDQEERQKALREAVAQGEQAAARRARTERTILQATAELAELYLTEDRLAHEVRQVLARRDALRDQRKQDTDKLQQLRGQARALEQQKHAEELEAERLRRERSVLADRLKEDYDIEVADLSRALSDEEKQEREEVEAEIADLRRKITNLGAVNMDALNELSDLEERHGILSGQYQDLIDAKESLEKIIHRINADSRRLFSETLEAIRINFQALFRKVFGGGSADIVLEQDVDILEAGIDIIATPPGKHSLGLSLLSGGERALTAVTLLLAIFQYRPSPFCVLDEVDGPLDEANIGRFVDVLREFLEWTKFVVVTHSKKTMTAAHTLYGVTMQESGVSKRVSVQFEDVSDDGHISSDALQRVHRQGDDSQRGVA